MKGKLKSDAYLRVITVAILLILVGEREVKEVMRKATAELMGTMEMNFRHHSKASPGQSHLNLP
jgi:hypothetical protein